MKKIVLDHPHTHAGQEYAPGAVLTVPDDTARWLLDHSVGHEAAEPEPRPEPEKKTKKAR